MKRKHLGRLLAALALVAVVAVGRSAHGQIACGPLVEVTRILQQNHNERIVTVGTMGKLDMLIFSSAGGETWTIVTMNRQGRTCVHLAGKDLTTITPVPYTPPPP